MAKRYKNTTKYKNKDLKTVFRTTIYPEIKEKYSDKNTASKFLDYVLTERAKLNSSKSGPIPGGLYESSTELFSGMVNSCSNMIYH